MSSIDDIIRQRLDKLKGSSLKNPSVNSPISSSNNSNSFLYTQPQASVSDQVENLLTQLNSQLNIENNVEATKQDVDAIIRSRLDQLKSRVGCNFGGLKVPPSAVDISDTIHDEDFFQKAGSGLLELSSTEYDKSNSDSSDEDMDYLCVMCDKRSSLICYGCSKDLYCKNCFKKFHCSEEKHKYSLLNNN